MITLLLKKKKKNRNSKFKLDLFLFACFVFPLFVYSLCFGKKKACYILAGYPVVGLPMMLLGCKVVLVRPPSCSSKPVCYHTSVVLLCLITVSHKQNYWNGEIKI